MKGETPTLEDYQRRFPEFAKVIAIQWQVDGILAEFVGDDESTSRISKGNDESVAQEVASHDSENLTSGIQSESTKLQLSEATPIPTAPLHGVPTELLKNPHYRIKRQIGRGGMGTVWLAEQLSMQRMVALKLIRPELAAKPESIARFRGSCKLRRGSGIRILLPLTMLGTRGIRTSWCLSTSMA